MAIDEQKFGELIGTVGALVTAVADLKMAVIPAIKEVRSETAQYREEARNRQDSHDVVDSIVHANVDQINDWMRGDGTSENLGARKIINSLVTDRIKAKAYNAGIAAVVSIIIGCIGYAAETFHK